MFCSSDRRLFSGMTEEECKELLKTKGNDLIRYTMGQKLEMKIKSDNSKVFVLSKDGVVVDIDITVEDFISWKKS